MAILARKVAFDYFLGGFRVDTACSMYQNSEAMYQNMYQKYVPDSSK
jgi:hypothetical protein